MSYSLLITVLVALAAGYVAFCLMTPSPQWTLYVYLALWAFFPKAARIVYFAPGAADWPTGVTMYTALEAIAFFGIGVAVLKNRRPITREMRPFLRLSYLLPATAALSIITPLLYCEYAASTDSAQLWRFVSVTIEPQFRLLPALSLVYACIFALGCVTFLRTPRQVDMALTILVLSGIELTIEFVLIQGFALFPSLAQWAVHRGQRFNSLAFTEYGIVALASITAVAFICCFITSRKAYWLFLFLPLLALPILYSFQRISLLALLAVLGGFAAWVLAEKHGALVRIVYFAGALAICTLLLIPDVGPRTSPGLQGDEGLQALTAPLGQDVRPDYLSTKSWEDRIALGLRAMDTIVFLFPFGCGPEMLVHGLHFAPPTFADANSVESSGVYARLVSGRYATNSHNVFLEFVASYGILGFATIAGFVYLAVRNFRRTRRRGAPGGCPAFYRQAAVFAAMLGSTVHGFAEAQALPAAILMMLLYLTFQSFIHDTAGSAHA